MSERLHMIFTDMEDYLDHSALKTIILDAIPEQQERELVVVFKYFCGRYI
jgi:hypothetical protein